MLRHSFRVGPLPCTGRRPPERREPAGFRLGEILGTATVVAVVCGWTAALARAVLGLPGVTTWSFVGVSLALLGVATRVDRRTRASLMDDPELARSWTIECARRRRDLAMKLLLPLVAIHLPGQAQLALRVLANRG